MPPPRPVPDNVIRATRLDLNLFTKLEAGAKVVLLPDGEKGSFPLQRSLVSPRRTVSPRSSALEDRVART